MRSERQKANLRRGGITPEAREKGWAARAANEAQDDAIETMALEDPMRAMEAMCAVALRDLNRALRRDARMGGEPSARVTSRMAQVRLLVESLNVYMARRQTVEDQAADFLASLADRIPNLERLARVAEPIFGPPSER